ncbi:uridine kinase [Actinotalea sp. K2]|uniref:uridine kinase n=1 Tax=Actinotalea sp. K2 TaxID=2939438 RepID=UPI0020172E62|nr:uridine kinase [Actinotalea sp. K2]MCL3860913.1 uridine kinase [Actinotalea sp. K2]
MASADEHRRPRDPEPVDLVSRIADDVRNLLTRRPRVLVAVDGPDAAGKTTLADDAASRIGGAALRASVDDFHRPSAERAVRGALSPEAYYEDTFDLERVQTLLEHFAAGAREVTTKVFDHRTDRPTVRRSAVPREAAMLVDGVFLLRPELRHHWDLAIYLHVPEEVTIDRALRRDVAVFGDERSVLLRYRTKYLPGQALYRSVAAPLDAAHLVVDNSTPTAPRILRERAPRPPGTPDRQSS